MVSEVWRHVCPTPADHRRPEGMLESQKPMRCDEPLRQLQQSAEFEESTERWRRASDQTGQYTDSAGLLMRHMAFIKALLPTAVGKYVSK